RIPWTERLDALRHNILRIHSSRTLYLRLSHEKAHASARHRFFQKLDYLGDNKIGRFEYRTVSNALQVNKPSICKPLNELPGPCRRSCDIFFACKYEGRCSNPP